LKFNKKGVSGAISAMFIIAIFFICLVSTFVIQGLTNSYNQTVLDRNRMDWERTSEHVTFIKAIVADNVLNATFSNDGRVTLHIVQVWLSEFPNDTYSGANWQIQFWTSRYISSGETVNGFGFFPDFKRINVGSLGSLTSLSGLMSEYYKIKLVTERGNTFECQVPYPPPSFVSGSSTGYELVIVSDPLNFQYAAGGTGPPPQADWPSAYVKERTDYRIIYSILLRNNSNRTIYFGTNTYMLQRGYSESATVQIYAVSKSTKLSDSSPTRLQNDETWVDPGKTINVWFAYDPQRDQKGYWAIDASGSGGGKHYLIGFLINWRWEGEPSTWRWISLPTLLQELT